MNEPVTLLFLLNKNVISLKSFDVHCNCLLNERNDNEISFTRCMNSKISFARNN